MSQVSTNHFYLIQFMQWEEMRRSWLAKLKEFYSSNRLYQPNVGCNMSQLHLRANGPRNHISNITFLISTYGGNKTVPASKYCIFS